MRAAAALLAALALAGCSSLDKSANTTFEPFADGHFTYRAFADFVHPIDSPDGEADRLEWLAEYIHDNHLCPSGYVVDERKPVTHGGIAGMAYDVFYTGHCIG